MLQYAAEKWGASEEPLFNTPEAPRRGSESPPPSPQKSRGFSNFFSSQSGGGGSAGGSFSGNPFDNTDKGGGDGNDFGSVPDFGEGKGSTAKGERAG